MEQNQLIKNALFQILSTSNLLTKLKKAREKKARLEARIFQQMEGNGETKGVDHLAQTILKSANLIEKINEYNDEIKVLLAKRKDQPSRISIAEMPPQQRYNKLMIESKKLKNAIIMVVYRAEQPYSIRCQSFIKAPIKRGVLF